MRPALRAASATVGATALLATSWVLIGTGGASATTPTPSTKSTLNLRVDTARSVGSNCTLSLTLTVAGVQLGGQKVVVQGHDSTTKTWKTVTTVTTAATHRVSFRKRIYTNWAFRLQHAASTKAAASTSKVTVCRPHDIGEGSDAPAVIKFQKKLKALRIKPASTTGRFDYSTLEAVWTFQKMHGLKRTGRVDASVYAKIMSAKAIKAPSWCKAADHICVDFSQQVAYIKVSGHLWAFPVSSGGDYHYTDPKTGARDYAHTPRGTYHIYIKEPGTTHGPLGVYYWFSGFTGGYGIHGEDYVPATPVSHGCVREPVPIELWVYKNLPIGAQVHLHD